jgi:RimJ/RimL family protein N-acetyltransferase
MIKGKKVQLKPAALNDRRQVYEWLAQSDTTSQMMGPPLFPDQPIPTWEEFTSDYTEQYFNDTNAYQGKSFIIEVQGLSVGHINYNKIDQRINSVELDIWLAGSYYCGKGYGTDAITTLCNYLAGTFNCHTFILAPSARNGAAIRAYEKCGFQPSNEQLPHFTPDYFDTVVMIKRVAE